MCLACLFESHHSGFRINRFSYKQRACALTWAQQFGSSGTWRNLLYRSSQARARNKYKSTKVVPKAKLNELCDAASCSFKSGWNSSHRVTLNKMTREPDLEFLEMIWFEPAPVMTQQPCQLWPSTSVWLCPLPPWPLFDFCGPRPLWVSDPQTDWKKIKGGGDYGGKVQIAQLYSMCVLISKCWHFTGLSCFLSPANPAAQKPLCVIQRFSALMGRVL